MRVARYALAHKWIGVVATVVAASCGGSDSTGAGSINYSGTWTGTLGASASDNVAVTWAAVQSGSGVSGPLTFHQDDGSTFAGTMAGTIANSHISLTVTVPAGTFTAFGGPATCSVQGTGTTTTATATSIAGPIQVTFAASCIGTIADQASETDQLTLTKQ